MGQYFAGASGTARRPEEATRGGARQRSILYGLWSCGEPGAALRGTASGSRNTTIQCRIRGPRYGHATGLLVEECLTHRFI